MLIDERDPYIQLHNNFHNFAQPQFAFVMLEVECIVNRLCPIESDNSNTAYCTICMELFCAVREWQCRILS